MAWASTVAVVVPSPATSLVLVATSFASWAPRFSFGSSSSTSRATVTPSLVIVGAPHFLSITTLRPLGPSVTLTASARWLTPRSSARRASSSNSKLLAMSTSDYVFGLIWVHMTPPRTGQPSSGVSPRDREPIRGGKHARVPPRASPRRMTCSLLLDDGEHVTGGEH